MPHGRSPRHARRRPAQTRPSASQENAPSAGPQRLQKILARAGFGSRRGVEELLLQGRVTVNGELASLGDSADLAVDKVALDGETVRLDRNTYWMVNKPEGVVTTVRDDAGRRTIIDLLPRNHERVFPVGRLDRHTEGLVLLTNDGALTNSLLHPSLGSEREYTVVARGEVTDKVLRKLARGVPLEDGWTSPARVQRPFFDADADTTTFTLILKEGRKRQIRRSMLVLGHPVRRLTRTRMGSLKLGSLARGAARELSPEEVRSLLDHAAGLTKSRRPRRSS